MLRDPLERAIDFGLDLVTGFCIVFVAITALAVIVSMALLFSALF